MSLFLCLFAIDPPIATNDDPKHRNIIPIVLKAYSCLNIEAYCTYKNSQCYFLFLSIPLLLNFKLI
ncbi:hypothetical protein SaSA9_0402 [Streptococcus agalactiae]|nr:hypothetical protein SaSA30_0402 [Streptococcus agalactiae]AUO81610.1 hypothetical protein SaSA33_0402 [Streptococcus agalactiae]AUO86498.1 hypothetical protein SaSA1_0403 [Streptococcus agalactiae]AUO88152.1 hypothetical protein SaSA5_0401 [Streptococcus agalactiae]AUO89804.1 hypothetical protein SaSA9_0402 [Streptococcus agalactiae]